ncbi:MAG: hypothetical protein HFI19_14180 [Lachnospiraceae bacterium]|jgi:D-3-phosphoglycerate dehydrogenase|nr:hypothetical protein [Lachnospiraceae bacterium]
MKKMLLWRRRKSGTKDGLVGNLLCKKTVGIVGAGAIGKRTAAICKAFGCTVIAYSEEVLKRSDIVFENLYSWLDGKQINCI